MNATKHYVIEGNVAAGKSTILKHLQKLNEKREIKFWTEPLNTYVNVVSKECPKPLNILQSFYDNSRIHGFEFQMVALHANFESFSNAMNNGCVNIYERCHLSGKEVFSRMLHDQGIMTETQWNVYCYIFELVDNKINKHLDGIIYIDTPAHICDQRLKIRNRKEEHDVPLSYLAELELYYKRWIKRIEADQIKILKIDNTLNCQNFDKSNALLQKFLNY